jgi:hypothetical protein
MGAIVGRIRGVTRSRRVSANASIVLTSKRVIFGLLKIMRVLCLLIGQLLPRDKSMLFPRDWHSAASENVLINPW